MTLDVCPDRHTDSDTLRNTDLHVPRAMAGTQLWDDMTKHDITERQPLATITQHNLWEKDAFVDTDEIHFEVVVFFFLKVTVWPESETARTREQWHVPAELADVKKRAGRWLSGR